MTKWSNVCYKQLQPISTSTLNKYVMTPLCSIIKGAAQVCANTIKKLLTYKSSLTYPTSLSHPKPLLTLSVGETLSWSHLN